MLLCYVMPSLLASRITCLEILFAIVCKRQPRTVRLVRIVCERLQALASTERTSGSFVPDMYIYLSFFFSPKIHRFTVLLNCKPPLK